MEVQNTPVLHQPKKPGMNKVKQCSVKPLPIELTVCSMSNERIQLMFLTVIVSRGGT